MECCSPAHERGAGAVGTFSDTWRVFQHRSGDGHLHRRLRATQLNGAFRHSTDMSIGQCIACAGAMQQTEHSLIEPFGFHPRRVDDGSVHRVSLAPSRDCKVKCFPEKALRPPIEAHLVGMADNRFYAQKGREETLYVLPKAAFVTKGNAILADGRGDVDVWLPSPQDAPEYLGGVQTVIIVGLSGSEEDRHCEQVNCSSCRNPECLAYVGPQGHGAPSWHTLSPRGKVASAWTLSDEFRHR